jgi:hypothetical protein
LSNAADRDGPLQLPCSVEPFDPERHDRSGFSCGVEAVDNYFKKTANKLAKASRSHHCLLIQNEEIMVIAGIPMEELRHTRAAQDWLAAGREEGRQAGHQRRAPGLTPHHIWCLHPLNP